MNVSVPLFRVGCTITTAELNKLYKQVKLKGVTMTTFFAKAVAMSFYLDRHGCFVVSTTV